MRQRCALVVTEERSDRVARLSGALDADATSSVGMDLQRLCGEATGWRVVDLSGVSALDGQGARLLATLSRRGASGAGARLRLRAPSHYLQAIIAAAATISFWG